MSDYKPRVKVRFREEVRPKLLAERSYVNLYQVPTVEKIVVNMGVGDAIRDGRMLEAAVSDLETISNT